MTNLRWQTFRLLQLLNIPPFLLPVSKQCVQTVHALLRVASPSELFQLVVFVRVCPRLSERRRPYHASERRIFHRLSIASRSRHASSNSSDSSKRAYSVSGRLEGGEGREGGGGGGWSADRVCLYSRPNPNFNRSKRIGYDIDLL